MVSVDWSSTVLAVLLSVLRTNGIYIPGIDPIYYKMGERIDVKGIDMTNRYMPLKNAYSWVPHGFTALPLCLSNDTYDKFQNFGQLLRGDRKINAGYELEMGKNVTCRSVCSGKPDYHLSMSDNNWNRLAYDIRDGIYVRLEIGNLPGVSISGVEDIDVGYPIGSASCDEDIDVGYPIGSASCDFILINNYLRFILYYHKHGEYEYRIVGFEIWPDSVNSSMVEFESDTCHWYNKPYQPVQYLKREVQDSMYFLYSVDWVEGDASYNARRNTHGYSDTIKWHLYDIYHWFILSFIFTVVITGMVSAIRRREPSSNFDESINEVGWRSLHGDVFRIPKNSQLFAAIIGTGIQICCTLVTTAFFGTIGLISITKPGGLVICVLFSYGFFGLLAGYLVARLLGDDKPAKKSLTGSLLVSIDQTVFETCLFFSLIFIVKQSNAPVPCKIVMGMLACFIGLSTFCVYIGDYYGRRKVPFAYPIKTNEIPREINIQRSTWWYHLFIFTIGPGCLLFSVLLYTLPKFFTSMYIRYEYSIFGIYFIDFFNAATLCSQITILVIYWQFSKEDYRWWWRSFYISGSSAIFIFIYSVYYYGRYLLNLDAVSTLMYFGVTTVIIVAYWLLFGTIGFCAAYIFIRQIYGTVKINAINDKKSDFVITEKPPQISSTKEEESLKQ